MNNPIRLPIQVVFRDMGPSEAVESKVRELAEKLGRYYDGIMSCRIMIEINHKHQHKGRLFHVRIDLTVPNAELVVNRSATENHAHENVYVAIRDSFAAMRRKLQHFARKQQGIVKHYDLPYYDNALEMAPLADYEYTETAEAQALKLLSDDLIDYDVDRREVDSEISYLEAEQDKKQAVSPVYIKRDQHVAGK